MNFGAIPTRGMVVSDDTSCLMMRCLLLLLCGAIVFAVSGCGRKAAVNSQVSELEKAFQDTSAAVPGRGQPPLADQTGNAPANAKAYVNLALSAVQSNDFAGGVIALQAAQQVPMITAEQHRAIYETMQAMTADLVARAEKGDTKAKAQLAAIERTRSQ
jgi:hypothetical protein